MLSALSRYARRADHELLQLNALIRQLGGTRRTAEALELILA